MTSEYFLANIAENKGNLSILTYSYRIFPTIFEQVDDQDKRTLDFQKKELPKVISDVIHFLERWIERFQMKETSKGGAVSQYRMLRQINSNWTFIIGNAQLSCIAVSFQR